ncbi:hypothetical protein GGR42_002556 [Saonia flava]|uniref:Sensor of ECF-type sigma factor n=1 Tax=Saonia flava TaxID=523696 RepID=A0A846R2A4_9FLAO|nr:hypothetical protein [Saonia flava]NJB72065.1 hypothetical protein [Saonia flava]
MMKNRIVLFIAVFLMTVTMSFGQDKPDFEKIKALKVAFFTERLSLSSNEAESFWPIYNEYEEKRHRLGKEQYHGFYSKLGDENISEKEADALLNKYLSIEEEEEELDKAFMLKVKKMLSAKKTLLLVKAEKDFQKELIRGYRKKHGGR